MRRCVLFSGKKIRPCTFDLLAIKLKKIKVLLLPKVIFFLIFFFVKNLLGPYKNVRCALDFLPLTTNLHTKFQAICLTLILSTAKKTRNFSKESFNFLKEIKIAYCKLDLYYVKTMFLNKETTGVVGFSSTLPIGHINFTCVDSDNVKNLLQFGLSCRLCFAYSP